ncbi:MAG: hypothetical protein ACE5HM_01390 [Acidiferrobacterales bacterium]
MAKAEREAKRLGISAPPTVFVNGRRLHTHDLECDLAGAIETALGEEAKGN